MKKAIDFITLKKEAYLFDARLYILKAFTAVLVAYPITSRLPLVQKDIISMLFGLMMTLEPVTVTGIRSGFKQITATLLGALTTAVVITALGINVFTVAFSVSATLFLCLKINWREVSPVAIFTSIYMTQFVQHTVDGEPSPSLTFLLRILALGTGIGFAIIFNFIFASFFYKKMEHKRIAHILSTLTDHMTQVIKGVEEQDASQISLQKELLPGTFLSIDWLSSLIRDKEKEASFKKKLHLNSRYEETEAFRSILVELRNVTHLIYDTTYMLSYRLTELSDSDREAIAGRLLGLIKESAYLAEHCEGNFIQYETPGDSQAAGSIEDSRLGYNLCRIGEMLDKINNTIV